MKQPFEIDFLESYDESSIIGELQRIGKLTGKNTVTKSDLKKYGRVSWDTIRRQFGSLRKALERAQLTVSRYAKPTEKELIDILLDLWQITVKKHGRRPEGRDLKKFGYPVSRDTYARAFGSWKKALIRAYNSIADNTLAAESNDNKPAQQTKNRQTLSLHKRFFILKRDQFACKKCGASGHGVKLEVDHIVPFSKGGSDNLSNLKTLCFECNQGKRASYE